MTKPVHLLMAELGGTAPSALSERLVAEPRTRVASCRVALNVEILAQHAAAQAPDAIVLIWNACTHGAFALETILQHRELSRFPLVIAYERAAQTDLDFFKECQQAWIVPYAQNHQQATERLLHVVQVDRAQSRPDAVLAKCVRTFFHHLHNERLDDAEAFIDTDMFPLFSEADIVYFKGLVLKYRKKFTQAITHLAHGLRLTQKNRTLEPRFLHLIGNVYFKATEFENAAKFLEAAHKVSPKNLRRRFLLGLLYHETGAVDRALAAYRTVYGECPDYPGIHPRLAELLVAKATRADDLVTLPALLSYVDARKLQPLFRRLTQPADAAVRAVVSAAFKDAFLKHAQTLVANDDLYGAINLYALASKVLVETDQESKVELLFLCAEAHLQAGDVEPAERFSEKLLARGVQSPRLTALQAALSQKKSA